MTTGRINQITILTHLQPQGQKQAIVRFAKKTNEFSSSTENRNISRSRTQSYRIVFESARVNVVK